MSYLPFFDQICHLHGAMTWLNLAKQYQGEHLKQQQTAFIENASTQVRLLFRRYC